MLTSWVIKLFILLRCLEEAAQDKDYLRELISKEPEVVGEDMTNLLVRFLALPEGFRYLNGLDWIMPELALWKSRKCEEYAKQVELALAKGLNSTILQYQQSHAVTPITVPARAFSRHPAAPSGLQYPDGGVDMEGFLRIPWNIEVKLSGPSVLQSVESDFIKLDTFLDSSDLGCPASSDMTSDALRLVKVRGIVMDSKGMPSGYAVMNDKTILSTLLCGVCPVTKAGTVLSPSDTPGSSGGNLMGGGNADADVRASVAAQHHSIHRRRNKSVTTAKSSYSTPDLLGMRSSLSELPSDGAAAVDVPMSMLSGHLQEWAKCKPSHRQKSRQISLQPESEGDDRFAIEVPGEPVVLIFSRFPPNMKPSDKQSSRYNPNAPVAYLLEVHYILRLQTGQSAFLPLPRHMYGELARTSQGLKLLGGNNIIVDLLASIHSSSSSSGRVISDLWALGHIASTDNGFKAVMTVDPKFVPWCIETATKSGVYSVRACAFTVLGLVSRTEHGSRHLNACQWECAPIHYVAVTVPRDHSVLFQNVDIAANTDANDVGDDVGDGDRSSSSASSAPASERARSASHFLERASSSFMGDGFDGTDGNIASKVLLCIGKLPGQILYKDAFATLTTYHDTHPEVFGSRELYLAVHEILALYSYKLSLRRMILGLFPLSAKKQP
jgi:rapamycin-insensitive companion of mTOR